MTSCCKCSDFLLTMSSLASLTAVIESTRIKGTAVVNQDREETCGMSCQHRKEQPQCFTNFFHPKQETGHKTKRKPYYHFNNRCQDLKKRESRLPEGEEGRRSKH